MIAKSIFDKESWSGRARKSKRILGKKYKNKFKQYADAKDPYAGPPAKEKTLSVDNPGFACKCIINVKRIFINFRLLFPWIYIIKINCEGLNFAF